MFKNFIFVVFIMGIFFGCSNKNMPDYSSKQYDNVDKDAILNAAKRVILLADKDYLIHSNRNEIEATKTVAKYKGFNVDIHINTIDFKAVEEDNITKAKLKLTVQDDYFSSKPEVIKNNAHELFWNRLEYILGLNEDWHSCTKHRLGLNFDGIFCNIQYNDNKVPSKATILTNITITEPQLISNDENISLVTIDLSVLESIKLPLVNVEQNESEVSIADINTSGLFDLGEVENNETNISIEIIDDLNTSLEENNITENEQEEKVAKDKEETEAKRLEEERIAKEKEAAEAKRLEEERLAKEKAEAEAKAKKEAEEKARLEAEKIKALEEARKLQERLEKERKAKEAEEAKRLEEERIAKEKAEAEAKAKKEAEEKARLEAEKIKALEEAKKLQERLEKERKAKEVAEAKRLEEERLAKEKAEAEAKAKKEAEEKARLEAEKIKALEEARKLQKKLEEERKAKKVEEERQKALEEIRKLREKINAKEASSN